MNRRHIKALVSAAGWALFICIACFITACLRFGSVEQIPTFKLTLIVALFVAATASGYAGYMFGTRKMIKTVSEYLSRRNDVLNGNTSQDAVDLLKLASDQICKAGHEFGCNTSVRGCYIDVPHEFNVDGDLVRLSTTMHFDTPSKASVETTVVVPVDFMDEYLTNGDLSNKSWNRFRAWARDFRANQSNK
jgi:hypothetical protein